MLPHYVDRISNKNCLSIATFLLRWLWPGDLVTRISPRYFEAALTRQKMKFRRQSSWKLADCGTHRPIAAWAATIHQIHWTSSSSQNLIPGAARATPKAWTAAAIVRSRMCARTICTVCGCRCWLVCRFDRNTSNELRSPGCAWSLGFLMGYNFS